MPDREPDDLVLLGGTIHALDPTIPHPEAIVVRAGRVAELGGASLARGFEGRRVDLRGATVVPGLIDAHAHFLGLGRLRAQVDLRGASSFEEAVARVRAAADATPPGRFVLGRGWNQAAWPGGEMPHHAGLSAATPHHPVLLRRVDGHATLANAVAMAGVAREASAPAGGEILRDERGELTGVFVDTAAGLLPKPPEPSDDELRAHALAAQDACLAAGLTGVHDAGVDERSLRALEALDADGALRLRLSLMLEADFDDAGPRSWLKARLARGPQRGERLTTRALKVFLDGALGSRGAAMLEPYSDRPSSRGLLQLTREELQQRARACRDAGFQACVHAIGDAANRLVLDVFERALGGDRDARWRIEHAQVLHPEDLPRFAALGVIASVQPAHATSDMAMAEERLGPSRLRGAYAWRSLLRSGARLALGSDFPVEDENPLWGIFAAAQRTDHAGHPPGGWRADEALTREEALRGFTIDAAHASFQEDELGSLSPGKRADFVVLPQDPLACDARELVTMKPVSTWVGGAQEWPR